MANIRTFFANAYETTLTVEMGPTDLTAEVATMDGAPQTPCRLVIDPEDPAKREYILFSGTSGTAFTISSANDRYDKGSAETSGITHGVGAVIKQAPLSQHFDDIHDRIEARLSTTAHTKSLHDSLGLSHASLSNLDEDAHTQYLNVVRHDTTSRHGSNVVDHGQIGGLEDDDHPQYALLTGIRPFTGEVEAPRFTSTHEVRPETSGDVVLPDSGPELLTIEVQGNITFLGSIATGRTITVLVIGDSVTRSLGFTSLWTFVGEKPTEIAANTVGILTVTGFGGDPAFIAAWAVSE